MQKTNNNLIIKHFSRKREATALRLLLDVADKRGVSTPHILEGTQVTEADLSDPYFEIEAWQELVAIQNLVERDGDAASNMLWHSWFCHDVLSKPSACVGDCREIQQYLSLDK